jgi:hypothetical protein
VRRDGKGHCDCNGGKGRPGSVAHTQRRGSKDLRGVTVMAHKQGRRQACVGVERVTVTVMVAKGDRVSVATHNAAGLKTSEGSL